MSKAMSKAMSDTLSTDTPSDAPPTAVIGCDVGKSTVVIHHSGRGHTEAVPNRFDALEAYLAGLEEGCLIVCESTGGYEAVLLGAALGAGQAAHRADARKVKAFIRSYGTLGKSDTLDARALARYGTERHRTLARWKAPDADRDRLQALVLTRRDLVVDRQAWRNRNKAPGAASVAGPIAALIESFSAGIKAIEAEIAALADRTVADDSKALRSITGIGKTTAPALLALMPELGTVTGRQAAALAGVAPHPNQSGNTDAYRPTRGGRPEVKRVLFMAALSASRHDPVLKPAYKAMIARGKKRIVALVAIMRRLIVIANARLRDSRSAVAPQITTAPA